MFFTCSLKLPLLDKTSDRPELGGGGYIFAVKVYLRSNVNVHS